MSVLLHSFSFRGTRMKLIVGYALGIVAILYLCIAALIYSESDKAVLYLGHQQEKCLQNLQMGVEEFYSYRLSGNEAHLIKALDWIRNANEGAATLASLDSLLLRARNNQDGINALFELSFSQSLNDRYSNLDLGNFNRLFKYRPENMLRIQQIASEVRSAGTRMGNHIGAFAAGLGDASFATFNADLEKISELTVAFDSEMKSLNDFIHDRIMLMMGLIVLLVAIGFTLMIYFMVRSVELRRIAEQEHDLQRHISTLDDSMRGNYAPEELSLRIIQMVEGVVGATLGALYFYDSEQSLLRLCGTSGIDMSEVKTTLAPGEGFAGKASGKKELSEVLTKGNYYKFYGASGIVVPEYVYLLPLYYDQELQGVLELGCLSPLGAMQKKFLTVTSERMALSMRSSLMIARNNALLLENKEQAEILRQQQVELNMSMQATLIQEKALLDSMLNTLPDNIYFKDRDSKFIRISESMVRFFGVKTASEVIGKSDFDFQSPENAQKYYEEEQQIIRTGKGFYDVVVKEIDNDGKTIWSSISKLPLFDETGSCIGTFGISKNITNVKEMEASEIERNKQLEQQQKELHQTIAEMNEVQRALKNKMEENAKMQESLEWENSLMNALLNNIPDSIYFKDRESKFLKVSASMSKKFNMPDPSKIVGLTDFDVHDSAHAQKAFEDEQKIIRTLQPLIGLVEMEKCEGRDKYVLTTKMPFFDTHGNVMGTFGISKDITDLKQMELEISHQNQQLMTQQEELRVSNDELNAQQEELKAANEELQSQEEELRVANEELEARSKELEMQRKEVEAMNRELLQAQGELLQKAQDLERASQYKSEFLANMSHELRTPLNSLLILSKILASNKGGNLTQEQIKSASIIYNSGKDLLELINELLDLSKIEAGKMTLELNDVSVRSFEQEIRQMFTPIADEKKLSLMMSISDDFPEVLRSDRQRLLQILRNLLGNAFKFTQRGSVTVSFSLLAPRDIPTGLTGSSGSFYSISVRDTGVGIPKAKLDAIFEAFQQADGSISRRFGGTGLGLSISKHLARMLGGLIRVESIEGKGSVFTLVLPLDGEAKDSSQDASVPEPSPARGSGDPDEQSEASEKQELPVFIEDDRQATSSDMMVLIIHPEKSKAKKILKQCHSRKVHAVVARSISDGIVLAATFLPHAIILAEELNVPGDFRILREHIATSGLPVHLVSRIGEDVLDGLPEFELPSPLKQAVMRKSPNVPEKGLRRILMVEDDAATRETIRMLLGEKEVDIVEAVTAGEAYDLLRENTYECVILDLGLPDYSGKELLQKLKQENIPVPNVIIHTASDLSEKEFRELQRLSRSIVIKGLKSDERLMDEVTLFLHQLSSTLPGTKSRKPSVVSDGDGLSGKKVLIVDDDIRNIFALAQVLEENGMTILEAENGQVALDVLQSRQDIDLILMDLMMPEMDGLQAMEEIRKMDYYREVPIITVSAKAMKEDQQKAMEFGANDYISKPVDDEKLISLIKIWLKK